MSHEDLRLVAPAELADARKTLHWAAQAAAAAGTTLAEARGDDSHTSFEWLSSSRCFAGARLSGHGGRRAAFDPAGFRLHLLDAGNEQLSELPLDGRPLSEATAWLARELGVGDELRWKDYDLPEHPAAGGAPLAAPSAEARRALTAWFALAGEVLGPLADGEPAASCPRCWPHHFDLASLVDLGAGRSVGIGLSPGDGSYAEPYLYASPWPYPEGEVAWPELPAGAHWHREGFTAAVLTGTALLEEASPAARAAGFAAAGLAAGRRLLEA